MRGWANECMHGIDRQTNINWHSGAERILTTPGGSLPVADITPGALGPGDLVLNIVQQLQSQLCRRPNHNVSIHQGPVFCKKNQNPLTCTPYGQSVRQLHCCIATGQSLMTGHRGWHQTRRRRHSISGFLERSGHNCQDTGLLCCYWEHLNEWTLSKEVPVVTAQPLGTLTGKPGGVWSLCAHDVAWW